MTSLLSSRTRRRRRHGRPLAARHDAIRSTDVARETSRLARREHRGDKGQTALPIRVVDPLVVLRLPRFRQTLNDSGIAQVRQLVCDKAVGEAEILRNLATSERAGAHCNVAADRQSVLVAEQQLREGQFVHARRRSLRVIRVERIVNHVMRFTIRGGAR